MKLWKRLFFIALCGVLLPACTASKEFELDEPAGEVTLDGRLNADPSGGYTMYWGTVRNTGDVDVEDVEFVVDVYGAGDAYLGRFRGLVSTGVADEGPISTLKAGEAGPSTGGTGGFTITTTVPWGSATRAEGHAEFTVVVPETTTS